MDSLKRRVPLADTAVDAAILFEEEDSKVDSEVLHRLGKQQILNRNFAYLSILSFSCTVLATWEGLLSLFSIGFVNGGPVGLLGQFIMAWGGTLCTFISVSELASMAPTAGGQYHWVSMMAPKSYRNFASYMIGWLTALAWIAVTATGTFLVGIQIRALAVISFPEYIPEGWHTTLITWGVIAVCVFINTIIGSLLPKIEGAFMVLHIVGFFAILIPLVHFSPKGSASEIFSRESGYIQGGGYSSYGVTFLVGLTGSAAAFAGADAAVHMTEEVHNAALNVPRSIVATIIINGALGFGMLIAVLFCLGDPDQVLEAGQDLGVVYIEIFLNGTRSLGGTIAMSTILIVIGFSNAVGFIATGSRMIWSFARDNGLPFSATFRKVSTKQKIPVLAVLVTAVCPCLLLLISIGSVTVFNNVTSLAIVALYASYFITCAFLLYHRLKGSIRKPVPNTPQQPAYQDEKTGEYILTWGPWHVPGITGTIINVIALCYLLIVWVFNFLPPAVPANAASMNYACVVFGGVVIFSAVYYAIRGRFQYTGPIIEIRDYR